MSVRPRSYREQYFSNFEEQLESDRSERRGRAELKSAVRRVFAEIRSRFNVAMNHEASRRIAMKKNHPAGR